MPLRRFFQRIAPGLGNARIHFGGREAWTKVLPSIICVFRFHNTIPRRFMA
jgi:hypothetical protein